jgi:hypothetical protein
MYRFLVFVAICSLLLTIAIGATFEFSAYSSRQDAASNIHDCPSLAHEAKTSETLLQRLSVLAKVGGQLEFGDLHDKPGHTNISNALWHASDLSKMDRLSGDGGHLRNYQLPSWHASDHSAGIDDLREDAEHNAEMDTASLLKLRKYMFWVLGSLYVVFLVASVTFGWHILKVSQEYDDKNSTMKDFSVVIDGLPTGFRDAQLLEDYLRKYFGHEIIGVSIAFDYLQHAELVDAALDNWLLQEEAKHTLVYERDDAKEGFEKSQEAQAPASDTAAYPAKTAPVGQYVDGFILGDFDDNSLRKRETFTVEQQEEVIKMLEQVECSGKAYVVFERQTVVDAILATAGLNAPLFRFNDILHKLTFRTVWSEPEDIVWDYHVRRSGWNWRIPVGVLICLTTMILYLVSLIPLVKVYISVSMVPGVSTNPFNEILLGVLPAIGGAIMCMAVDQTAEWVGYHERDSRDLVVGGGAFVLTCVTVVGDLYLTLQIAQGSALDNVFAGSPVPFDRELATQLFFCCRTILHSLCGSRPHPCRDVVALFLLWVHGEDKTGATTIS